MRRCIPWGRASLCCASFALLAALGCGGSADGLDRRAVTGTVTLDGAPLPSGMISFDPADGSPGAVSAGAVITDGSYSIPADSGPTPGKYKVSVRSSPSTPELAPDQAPGDEPPPKKGADKDLIPEKYNAKSTLTAEIPESGSQPINFELDSK